MVVMILEKVPTSLRGELSRWMIEPHPGVFVGHVSGMVRDRLWDKVCGQLKEGGAVQAWSTNREQRFMIRMAGNTDRQIVDYEGLYLVQRKTTQSRDK
ncbi:MAG: type I-E CRISPR-associated endoribonuclease Cas2 [Chloroflexi bacterium]|nr:MAG: type I-E CRISPR-associated endoribonuclease Cas2 [Chloroflexota bacterium]